jgi:protein subunit release factor A
MDDIKIEVMRARGAGGQVVDSRISSTLCQLTQRVVST